ncbi:hypothetical protein [Sphingomonas sp. PB1R3]|uniref:hypothetical protein n=1 Tax=Sphingomonas flavida TaxID=3096154 RepID=UPI002FC69736
MEPLDPVEWLRLFGTTHVDNLCRRIADTPAEADHVRAVVVIGAEDELIGLYATDAYAID